MNVFLLELYHSRFVSKVVQTYVREMSIALYASSGMVGDGRSSPALFVPSSRSPNARIRLPKRIVKSTIPHPSQTTNAANVLVQPTPMRFCVRGWVSHEAAEIGREQLERTIMGRTKADAAADKAYRHALREGSRVSSVRLGKQGHFSLLNPAGSSLVDGDHFA